mmetsp:Transcript_26870/g.72571  ORF Transcript_26870/g.72571 Transcript_26870/m.72571 type:complete len:113 (-) Transcript_26870:667-1005(-)
MAISGGAAGRSSGGCLLCWLVVLAVRITYGKCFVSGSCCLYAGARVWLGLSAGNWNKLTSLIRLYLLRVVCHARMAAAAEDAVVHECVSGTWWAAHACDAAVLTLDFVCASC